MFLDIKELELHPLEFAEELQPDVIDLGGEARMRGPLKASGRVEVVEEHHGKHQVIKDIRLRGRLSAGLELQCARCLEPVPQNVKRDFELLYRPLGADAGRDELSVTDAEAEIGYYQGEGISARRCPARAAVAGIAPEGHVPRGLQGTLSAVRQEFESGTMFLLDRGGRSAVGGVEGCTQPAGTLRDSH